MVLPKKQFVQTLYSADFQLVAVVDSTGSCWLGVYLPELSDNAILLGTSRGDVRFFRSLSSLRKVVLSLQDEFSTTFDFKLSFID